MQAQIAFSGNGHTKRTVRKHFNLNKFALRSANILLADGAGNGGHLVKIQLAGGYHHIAELREKPHGFYIGDIQLGRCVNLNTFRACVLQYREVAGDNGRQLGFGSRVNNAAHEVELRIIDNGVHRQVRFQAVLLADAHNAVQVADGEVVGRVRPHIQILDTEID